MQDDLDRVDGDAELDEELTEELTSDVDQDIALAPEEIRVARDAFLKVVKSLVPFDDSLTFKAVISQLDEAAKPLLGGESRSKESLRQALAKLHGDWFEWLLCMVSHDVEVASTPEYIALRLPNVTQFDAAELYQLGLAQMIQGLRTEVQKSNVELITSNPDFVLVDRQRMREDPVPPEFGPEQLEWHINRFRTLIGECAFEDIKGFLAAKYTLRPDRRLQMSHEGSLMKALYVHLQTRLWRTAPHGLSFYAVATRVGPADRKGLRTVATHSITTVASRPQPAVDKVFETKTVGQARAMFTEILGK